MTAIVLLVQALEAFINVEGYHRLSPNLWKAVERMNLRAKWSVVTRLTSGHEWDEDRQPFLDFAQLIRIRNELIHYRPRYEMTEGTFRTGTDFQDRFTGRTARRFFVCVCQMFEGFYAKVDEELPDRVQPGARSRGIILIVDNQQDDVNDEN